METQDLVEWLFNEGGPAIRYRLAVEIMDVRLSAERKRLSEALLQTDKIQWLLEQMGHFGAITHVDIRVLNSLHGIKPTCLENVIARLLERGLRAGMPAFDKRMRPFRQYVDNRLVREALTDPEHATVEGGRAVFIATVLTSYFLRGGYDYDEVWQFIGRRVEMLSHLAADRDYSIHLNGAELIGLPKPWAGKPIIRPAMVPTSGTRPLPLIHDIYALAYLPADRLAEQTRRQVDDIAAYVTDERYRALPPGYGYIWPQAKRRTCYACGWNLDLPDLDSPNPCAQRKIVPRLELLARLPAARSSTWFQKGLHLLETFRTGRSTYCFPPAYLVEMRAGYYVGGEYMGLEDGRRKTQALELESTFRMLLLKKLIA